MHINAGSRYKDAALWLEPFNTKYFEILKKYSDKIIIELTGHDHFASLRTHELGGGQFYHNLFVAPGITPWYAN